MGFLEGFPGWSLRGPGRSHVGRTASRHALVRVHVCAGGLSALPPASPAHRPFPPTPQLPGYLSAKHLSVLLLESKHHVHAFTLYHGSGCPGRGGTAWGPQLMKHHPMVLHFKALHLPFQNAEVSLSFVGMPFHEHHPYPHTARTRCGGRTKGSPLVSPRLARHQEHRQRELDK